MAGVALSTTGFAQSLDNIHTMDDADFLFNNRSQQHWASELQERLDAADQRLTALESKQAERSRIQQVDYLLDELPAAEAPLEDPNAELIERLETLEKNWEKQAASEAKKKADAAKKTTFEVGGRIHLDYWNFAESSPGIDNFEHPAGPLVGTDPEDRWAFRRIRMEFSGDIQQTMFWRMQVDFAETEDPAIKDVYIGFKELPGNQSLIIGHQKRPIGLDHWNSSRFNIFLERPLVVEAINEDARRLGVMMHGNNDSESFNWQYGVATLENPSDDGNYTGDASQYSLHFRLSGTPWYDETSDGRGYLHLAVAGMFANPDGDANAMVTDSNEGRFRTRMAQRSSTRWLDTGRIAGADWYEVLALEAMLNIGSVQFCSEYMNVWLQRDGTTPGTGPDVQFNGFYTQVSYFLTGEHIPIKRNSGQIDRIKPFENFFLVDRCDGGVGRGWGAWQVAGRYDYLDLTDNDVKGGVGNMATCGLNWYWTPYSRMQFNLIYCDIQDHAVVNGFTGGNSLTAGVRFGADF
ncbi:MAG: ATPase [Planctomycetaceae bacterium]|nr:ATPase [Planctomycetaceae bacterium]